MIFHFILFYKRTQFETKIVKKENKRKEKERKNCLKK